MNCRNRGNTLLGQEKQYRAPAHRLKEGRLRHLRHKWVGFSYSRPMGTYWPDPQTIPIEKRCLCVTAAQSHHGKLAPFRKIAVRPRAVALQKPGVCVTAAQSHHGKLGPFRKIAARAHAVALQKPGVCVTAAQSHHGRLAPFRKIASRAHAVALQKPGCLRHRRTVSPRKTGIRSCGKTKQ